MSGRQGHSSLLSDMSQQLNLLDLNELNEADVKSRQDRNTGGMLQRWLSMKSVISTASSNAILQQEAVFNPNLQVFRSVKRFTAEQIRLINFCV